MKLVRVGCRGGIVCRRLTSPRTSRRVVKLRIAAVSATDVATKRARSFDAVQKAALITAVKTPYLQSGLFDVDTFDTVVERQIQNGVEGLIIGGTTGEGHLMSWDEHIMLIGHCANTFGDRICIIGNTGSNSTREAVHASDQGFCVGMDAALHINPYYGKTSRQGLKEHFKAALKCGPGIVYNVPSRTGKMNFRMHKIEALVLSGQDIPNEVMYEIAEHENFLGVKECTGNDRIGNYAERGIKCWSGNDDESHTARHEYASNGAQSFLVLPLSNDSVGVVSVTSNLVPGLFSQLMHGEPNYELDDSLQS